MSDLDDTIPPPSRTTSPPDRVTSWSPRASAEVAVDCAGLSDRGRVRTDNQDHFYLARLGRFSQTLATSLPPGELPERLEDAGYVTVVADGMGGHRGGEIASRMAIILFFNLLFETPDWVLK